MAAMTTVNSCAVRVGRLMEIKVDRGYNSAEDVDQMIGFIREALSTLPASQQVVVAADWRGTTLMSPAAAERAHVMLTTVNDRIERSGILASPNSPVAVLQFVRLVRESHHPSRRIVYQPSELEAWLGPVLTPAEADRLAMFLR
jgi:hypothetical protein